MTAAFHIGWVPSEFWAATLYELTIAMYARIAPRGRHADDDDAGLDPERVRAVMSGIMESADA